MKKTAFCIGKSLLSVVTLPLWFAQGFVGVGYLPDQSTGELVEVIFRHSMFENICDAAHPVLPYMAMAIALASAVANALVLKLPNSKKMSTVADLIFVGAIGSFLILLLFASTVARGY